MTLSNVFFRLTLLIAPAVASSLVRRAGVASGAWSQAVAKSSSQGGLSFWRALRKDLEAKKKELASGDASLLSSAARRDLLWQVVRDVDDKFHNKYMCTLEEGTTYAKESMFLQGQAAYSKTNIASARECALMCAADSLADRSHEDLACKSFAYNKTAQECKFFNFAHQERNTWVNDACCSIGQPCNLASMREEIQTHFKTELKRTILNVPSQHTAPTVELKGAPLTEQLVPKANHKADAEVAPKVEQKAAPPKKQIAPAVVLKAGPEAKQVAPKVEQKAAPQTKHIAPEVVLKAAPEAKQVVKVKAAPLTNQVAPKVEQKFVTQAPKVELSVPSHADSPTEHKANLLQGPFTVVGLVLVAILSLALRSRGVFSTGGSLKQLGA